MVTDAPRRAAVAEDGTLNYSSVSAVQKFLTCNAAWYLRYVERLPDPGGKGAQESSECHARVEHYLKTGENILDEIELRAFRRGLFPAPNDSRNTRPDDLLLETSLDTLTADGVPFIVKIDCIDPRRVEIDGLIVVNDWKFKKDIRKYGVTPEELIDPTEDAGIQMIGYGEAVRRAVQAGRWPGTKTVRLRHVQVDKVKDDAEEVYIDVPIAAFRTLWEKVAAHLPKMKAAALAETVDSVDANKKACFKYGGCAFREKCPHYGSKKPEDQAFRLKSLFKPKHERSEPTEAPKTEATQPKEQTMGMLSKLNSSKPVTPAAVVAAPTLPAAPTPAPTPKPSLIIDESTQSDAVLKANPHVGQQLAAVLPPDAPKSAPAAVTPAPVATEPILTTSAEPKRRVRRTNAEIAAANALAAQAAHVSVESTAIAAQATPVAAQAAPLAVPATTAPVFSLFIGCAPRKGAQSLTPYVDGLEKVALQGFKEQLKIEADDIRLVTGSEVGFGKWKAVLGALAKESPPAPGRYTVIATGMDERVDAVVAALETLAADVVTR